MYRAKERGRNTFQMFSTELSERLARRRQLEGYLRDALDHDGFDLYYQPQYTLKRELIGLEALLRFRAPELKAVSPAEFIPIAEQTGLILEIGDWVIGNVCRQGVKWMERGFARSEYLSTFRRWNWRRPGSPSGSRTPFASAASIRSTCKSKLPRRRSWAT